MNDFVQLNTFCNLNCSFFSLRRAHTQANLAIDVDDDAMETALSSSKSRDVRARALRELAANGHGMQHDGDDALTAKVVQQHTSSSLMDVDAIQRTFLTPPNGWVDGACAGAAVDALRAVGGARGEDAARRALETLGSASRASGGGGAVDDAEEEVRMRALDALSRVETLTVEERRRWVVDPGLECVRAGAERGGGRLWANACSACCRAASGDRGEAYDDARVGIVVGMLGASTSGESDDGGGGGDSTTTTTSAAAERTKMLLRLAAIKKLHYIKQVCHLRVLSLSILVIR